MTTLNSYLDLVQSEQQLIKKEFVTLEGRITDNLLSCEKAICRPKSKLHVLLDATAKNDEEFERVKLQMMIQD